MTDGPACEEIDRRYNHLSMTQFNTPTYDLQRPTGRCAVTGNALEPGEKYFAALVEVDPEQGSEQAPSRGKPDAASALGLRRVDISREAWDTGGQPQRLFCYWLTTVPHPSQKRKLFVDDEVLLNLVRRLADDGREERVAFRFVIALILMRKKLLRYDGTESRGGVGQEGEAIEQSWWLMTPKLDVSKGQFGKWNERERLEVLDPKLNDERILQVTEQLGEILEAEL